MKLALDQISFFKQVLNIKKEKKKHVLTRTQNKQKQFDEEKFFISLKYIDTKVYIVLCINDNMTKSKIITSLLYKTFIFVKKKVILDQNLN